MYRAGQNETALVTTYSQLAEAHINQRDFAQAATALEALVQREPQNQQHRTKLDFVRSKLGGRAGTAPAPSAAPAAEPLPELIEEEFDLSQAEPEASFDLGVAAPPPRPAAPPPARTTRPAARPVIEASGPLSEEDKEFIEEHLGEGRVFRKYGLIDKAADQFEAVIARFPDNVDARKELLDVFKEKGLAPKVAEQCLALAEILRLKATSPAPRTTRPKRSGSRPRPPPPPGPPAWGGCGRRRPRRPPSAPVEEGELMLKSRRRLSPRATRRRSR